MAKNVFAGQSFLWRLLCALMLVGRPYNPEGYSYYHWTCTELPGFGPEQAVVGMLLRIGIDQMVSVHAPERDGHGIRGIPSLTSHDKAAPGAC